MNVGSTELDMGSLVQFMVIAMIMGTMFKAMGGVGGPKASKSSVAVSKGLNSSIREELKAASDYRRRAVESLKAGDSTTAELFNHVAAEEDSHYSEFANRLTGVAAGHITKQLEKKEVKGGK